jgi:multiple sugar transport system ATP-binding protein
MAYLEINGLPMRGSTEGFEPTVSLSLEKGRGLSVLSDDGRLSRSLVDVLMGRERFLGEIYLNGMRIDPMPPRKRAIRILGDTSGIIPSRTVQENLEIALRKRAVSEGEAAMLVERELTEGALAGLAESSAGSLDSSARTILAATRALFMGCDLLLITSLPVPGGRDEIRCFNPGAQLDTLLALKSLLRRLRATWVSLLPDSGCAHILSDRIAVFASGLLVQEGGLRECINAPSSRMIADLLTFPRMNYRTMLVERDGPFVMLRSGRYGFRVSEYIKRAVIPREGEEVVLGIRPEDSGFRPYETGDPTVMNLAKVTGVDALPANLVVRLDLEGDEWVSLVEPNRAVFSGQLIELRPDPDRIHLFHPAHGSSLLD